MANTYYISGAGDDTKDGLREGTAFRTFSKVDKVLQAGDTVYVMSGTYTNPNPNSSIVSIKGLQASATQPTTIKAYPGHTPIIEAHGNNWNAVSIIGSSHVVVEGLTMVGARDEITLEHALEQKTNLDNPATSGNGIQVTYLEGANETEAEKIHSTHVVLRNNSISKFPGGGIGTSEADYITGDRIQLDYDHNLFTVQLPKKLFYVGQVQGNNLSAAVRSAYGDKNQRTPGKQALNKNEAVFLTWKGHTYLSVNDKSRPFSANRDLVVDMTGIAMANRETKTSVLTVSNYFV